MEKNLHRNSFSHKVNIIINIMLIITLSTLNFLQISWWAPKNIKEEIRVN